MTNASTVTIAEDHTLYAHWERINEDPNTPTISVTDRYYNYITIKINGSDPDGDDLTFDVYANNSKKGTSSKIASGGNTTYKITGLSDYTNYSIYLVANDGKGGTAQSTNASAKTKCSGSGYTCTSGYECSGGSWTKSTCSSCGGSGTVSVTCPGTAVVLLSGTYECHKCGEKVSGSVTQCSVCGGSGGIINACSNSDCTWPGMEWLDHKTSVCSGTMEGYLPGNMNCPKCGASGIPATAYKCSKCSATAMSYSSCDSCGWPGAYYLYGHEGTCSSCNGSGGDYYMSDCSHGYSSSHMHCSTHDCDYSSGSSHSYCSHGKTYVHD